MFMFCRAGAGLRKRVIAKYNKIDVYKDCEF